MIPEFTPEAKRLWRTIPPDKQEKFLGNVLCSTCGGTTTMIDLTGREELRNTADMLNSATKTQRHGDERN